MKKCLLGMLFLFVIATAFTACVIYDGTNHYLKTEDFYFTVNYYVDGDILQSNQYRAYIDTYENGEKSFGCYEQLLLPEVAGYSCHGWFFDNEAWTSEFTEDGLVTYFAAANYDINVYAKAEIIDYSITYENTKGANLEHLPKSYTIKTPTFTLAEILVDHYNFNGWYANGAKVTEINLGTVGDIALTADFTPTEYDIVYVDTKDAQNINPPTYNVESGDIVLNPLSKEGFRFEGWYIDGKRVEKITAANGGNIEVLAKWSVEQ